MRCGYASRETAGRAANAWKEYLLQRPDVKKLSLLCLDVLEVDGHGKQYITSARRVDSVGVPVLSGEISFIAQSVMEMELHNLYNLKEVLMAEKLKTLNIFFITYYMCLTYTK